MGRIPIIERRQYESLESVEKRRREAHGNPGPRTRSAAKLLKGQRRRGGGKRR